MSVYKVEGDINCEDDDWAMKMSLLSVFVHAVGSGLAVELEPEHHEIECEVCHGGGFSGNPRVPRPFRPRCKKCGGAGVRIALVVIVDG